MFFLFTVWTVHGRSLKVTIDDQEPVDVEISVEAGKVTWLLQMSDDKTLDDEQIVTFLFAVCLMVIPKPDLEELRSFT